MNRPHVRAFLLLRLWRIVLLVVPLLVVLVAFSRVARAQSAIQASLFGINVGDPVNQWPVIKFASLGHQPKLGWAPREAQKNVYNWTDLDNYVNSAQTWGAVGFIYELGGNVPSWAGPSLSSMPTNVVDWDNYVATVATRYKGRIKYYEVWNEANVSFSGTVANMVTLAQHAWNQIKAIDPAAQVLTPSTTGPAGLPWNWFKSYLQAGGWQYADAGTFHGYVAALGVTPYPWPEQESTDGCLPPPPNAASPCSGSVMTKVNNFRAVMNQNGMLGKPLFDSEGSWGQNANVTDPDSRVAWLARWYVLQISLGVARVDWFAYGTPLSATGSGSRDWGSLLDTTGALTSAGTAYGVVYNWLVGATVSTACAATVTGGSTWTCGLTRSGGYQGLIVWNTGGSLTYKPSAQYTQYRDLTGAAAVQVQQGAVTIGSKPILLENHNP